MILKLKWTTIIGRTICLIKPTPMEAAILLTILLTLFVGADLTNKETGYINNNFEDIKNN